MERVLSALRLGCCIADAIKFKVDGVTLLNLAKDNEFGIPPSFYSAAREARCPPAFAPPSSRPALVPRSSAAPPPPPPSPRPRRPRRPRTYAPQCPARAFPVAPARMVWAPSPAPAPVGVHCCHARHVSVTCERVM